MCVWGDRERGEGEREREREREEERKESDYVKTSVIRNIPYEFFPYIPP